MKAIAITFFLIFIASADAIIITHSHCPNHSKNNSDNMHTHDTTDADHNAKHRDGHPHTYEFDEFCPKGTERDTSKKSKGFVGGFPNNPARASTEFHPTQPEEKVADTIADAPLVSRMPRQPDAPPSNILRVTHVSFAEVWGPGRVKTYPTLTLEITALTPDTPHNGLVIRINGTDFTVPYALLGDNLLAKGEVRRLEFIALPRNNAVTLKVVSPKKTHYFGGVDYKAIEDFNIDDFSIALVDRDTTTEASFDTDGNRIGLVRGAPSLRKPKLTTMWARLKQ